MAKVHLRAYNREIESMLDGGLFQEAVGHSLHILKTHPKHLETYRLLGKGYLELKQYSDAIDIFTRLLACVPNDFVANVGMGIIRDEENKVDDAIWHMERAFETQPSNPAIQSELQRLYTRRDGSAPPRIRMTRGALAQMYLQGELYPQAISEIKSVLTEDPGRTDMQVLLTRAHFRSGQKTEAAEVANSLLRRYPYCLEANRVLAEIFSVDRPENAGPYRQRVFELDPYAAHVTGSLSQSADAPESAIALEKLDWNGQPVGMPTDWRETRGISLPSETPDEQPAWLQSGYDKEDTVPPTPFAVPASPGAVPASSADANIPDFMRKAGWGESSGAFDESKSPFAEDESQPPAIAAGDLPDWVKDMAPAEAVAPAGEKEDVPDWMNRIDPGILGTTVESSQSPADQPDWLEGIGEPSYNAPTEQPASDEPDWLKGAGEPSYNAPLESSTGDQPDWLKDLGGSESTAQPASVDHPDWLKQETGETEKQETPALDFSAPQAEIPSQSPAMMENQPTSEKDLDDSFAWLEGLAAKQGATEGLLMKPEERLEQEPDWVRQAKSLTGELEQPAMTPPPAEEEAPLFVESQAQPSADLESLGKTEQEQDDSFAWLENLAAKQGATEGLLTKPEDRLQQEPDWVTQAKEIGEEETPPGVMEQPSAEGMDTAMWLRSLDQGETSEVPSTEPAADETAMWLKGLDEESKPEPAMESAIEDTSIWLKGLDEKEARSEPVSESADETAMWLKGLDEESKPEPAMESTSDDTSMWLKGLDETEAKLEPVSESADETAMWLKSLDEDEAAPEPASAGANLPDWMQSLETPEEGSKVEPTVPEETRVEPGLSEAEISSDWLRSFEEPETSKVPRIDTGGLPSWLRGIDQGESHAASQDDLPAWLRDETGEVVTEPTKIEPTRADEWQPAEEAAPIPVEKPKPASKKKAAPATRKAETQPEPYREPATRKGVGVLTTDQDPVLGTARSQLSRSNIPGALDAYSKLIKRGRFLDEVIFDLREALYRYPVEVSIWQSLGDAYMRANRLQDALDAYTKAEELLR